MSITSSNPSSSSFISPNHRRFNSKSHSPHNDNYYPIITSFCPSNIHQSSSFKLNTNHKFSIRAMGDSDESHGKETPDSKKPSPSIWKKWAVGLTFSILVPSFGHKMPPLLILKRKLDNVLERVETVSEVVEGLAEATQKLTIEVHKRLPEDADELKEATQFVHKLAKAVDKEAEHSQELIDKLEKIGEEVEELIQAKAAQEKTAGHQTKGSVD